MSDHPMLYFGLALLSGVAIAIQPSWGTLLSASIFLLVWRAPLLVLLVGLGIVWGQVRQPDEGDFSGEGVFWVKSAHQVQLPFRSSLVIEGWLNGHICKIYYPPYAKPPLDGAYRLKGARKGSIFRPVTKTEWVKVPYTYSFAGLRYRTKKAFGNYLREHVHDRDVADVLTALLTGEMDNQMVRFYFNRLGLSHILAISGFHFGLIALLLGWTLRRLFCLQTALGISLAVLGVYAFFLGDSPSVVRAFLMIAIYQVGQLTGRRCSALNAVGAALCIELVMSPLHAAQLGFMLSYSATLGILLFMDTAYGWMEKVLPKRSKEELGLFGELDLMGYGVACFLRKNLGLQLAVYVLVLPILLATFGSCSILGMVYNLFFPYLIAVSMVLNFLQLHFLNEALMEWMLNLVRYPPLHWNLTLNCALPKEVAMVLCAIIVIGGLTRKGKECDNHRIVWRS